MSLLMDALKRAEQARQAEAARRAESGADSRVDDTELTLDPIDAGIRPDVGEQTLDAGVSSSLPYGAQALEDSLVRMDDETDLELEPAPEFDAPATGPALGGGSSDFDFSLMEDTSASIVVPDDPDATLPSVRAAQRSVDEYFDGTASASIAASMAASRSDSLESTDTRESTGERSTDSFVGVDARPQIGDDATLTQRQAQVVFEAGRERPSGLRSVALAVVCGGFLAVLGVGVFTYWATLERLFIGQPTVIAKRPRPEAPPVQPAGDAVTQARDATLANTMRAKLVPQGADASNAGDGTPAALGGVPGPETLGTRPGERATGSASVSAVTSSAEAMAARAGETPAAERMSGSVVPATPVVTGADASAALLPADSAQTLPSSAMLAGASRASADAIPADRATGTAARASGVSARALATRAPAKGISRGGFGPARAGELPTMSISKRTGVSRKQTLLDKGYRAIQSGDDTSALKHYRLVLASYRNDRDALLGVAAVYVHRDDPGRALGIYSRLLKRNPRDSAAQAGVIALTDAVDPLAGESRIKALLRDEPAQPYLHFSLGNMYAAQARWAEAQQAFFDAYRLEDRNPDYAFNLAVSLDRLQQRQSALGYYKTAMLLAGKRYASFDVGIVAARIDLLELGANR